MLIGTIVLLFLIVLGRYRDRIAADYENKGNVL